MDKQTMNYHVREIYFRMLSNRPGYNHRDMTENCKLTVKILKQSEKDNRQYLIKPSWIERWMKRLK